ncbi:MAG: pirin family protein [Pseudomonadota bacterium]
MSWQKAQEPECGMDGLPQGIETVIVPRARDLGGFEVRRALPSSKRKTVGPFVFFDQMGPVELLNGNGLEVRPHPHIGLATVTYLFSGSIMHRDSLGTVQEIEPGAVNWMTAGQGIVHSERTSQAHNTPGGELFGIQTWIALPKAREEMAPDFSHHGAGDLPTLEGDGLSGRIILGSVFGKTSPVETQSETIYADVQMAAGARLKIPADMEDRAVYVVSGALIADGERYEPGAMIVFKPGAEIIGTAPEPARIMVLGGEPLDGPRHMWWNFVSSSCERIEAAKEDWRQGRFERVPDDHEFIPLPER